MDDLDLLREFRADSATSAPARHHARRRLDALIAGTDKPVRRPLRWLVAVPAAAVLAAAVAVTLPHLTSNDRAPAAGHTVFGDAVEKFPNDTASGVVSYADRVAVVTAISATEIPDNAPPARAAAGEGTINRRVTFRVDRTLWQRPGTKAAPATFESVWWGWALHDHVRSKFTGHGAPWVEVGSQYVMPLAYDEGAFAPIQPFAVFAYRDSAVVASEGQDTPLAQQLSGASLTTVATVFATATPDPAVAKHLDLTPSARLAAVIADR
jgi:hypothetical protein